MATIKDVANQAGVGTTTVSRVINNSGYVGIDTRKKIEDAMKHLGYRPSNIARGLVSKKTYTLGLIIPDITNPFFPDIARGVEDEAIENGFNLILCNSDWQEEREKMYLSLLHGKWCEGVILVGSRCEEKTLRQHIESIPFVSIDREMKSGGHSVWVDNLNGAFDAVNHLYEVGYRKVAFIGGAKNSRSALERLAGYKKAVSEYGSHSPTVLESDYRINGGYDSMMEFLQLPQEERPDAIFAANDLMGIGAMRALAEKDIQVGKEIGVIGFDGIASTLHTSPTLSTIVQPAYEMGRRACQLLLQEIKHPSKRLIKEVFLHKLVARDSTKKVP